MVENWQHFMQPSWRELKVDWGHRPQDHMRVKTTNPYPTKWNCNMGNLLKEKARLVNKKRSPAVEMKLTKIEMTGRFLVMCSDGFISSVHLQTETSCATPCIRVSMLFCAFLSEWTGSYASRITVWLCLRLVICLLCIWTNVKRYMPYRNIVVACK